MREPFQPAEVLNEPVVSAALVQAWAESKPGVSGGHEEGGFIVFTRMNSLEVICWPMGEGNCIQVPEHPGCAVSGMPIIASFHTHPNTGPDYLQEPSETDKRGIREDPELKGRLYAGEFVIADELIYLITPSGAVREIGRRQALLGEQRKD
jgi:hypothetical protein